MYFLLCVLQHPEQWSYNLLGCCDESTDSSVDSGICRASELKGWNAETGKDCEEETVYAPTPDAAGFLQAPPFLSL